MDVKSRKTGDVSGDAAFDTRNPGPVHKGPRKARKSRKPAAARGVRLVRVRRKEGTAWVARYRDPDTGREIQEGLTALGLSSDEVSIRTRTNKKYNFHLLNAGDGDRIRRLAARHTQITESD